MKKTAPFTLLSLLLLAACGFHPVYGTVGAQGDNKVAADLNDIAIDNIPDRTGQILRNDLIDRLYRGNRPAEPHYRLTVTVTSSEADLGILANATATRSMLTVTAAYTLTDAQGKKILDGTARSVASFDRLDQMYATVAAEKDAYSRTLDEICNQIVNRLGAHFAGNS